MKIAANLVGWSLIVFATWGLPLWKWAIVVAGVVLIVAEAVWSHTKQ